MVGRDGEGAAGRTKPAGPLPRAAEGGAAEKDQQDTGRDKAVDPKAVKEIGGPKGPEPTRYGDWEKGGRCSDF